MLPAVTLDTNTPPFSPLTMEIPSGSAPFCTVTLRGSSKYGPSFLLSPTGAGLTDILGWVEMELCDWLLVKDDVSRLTGDIGGVGLLHSECESEPLSDPVERG